MTAEEHLREVINDPELTSTTRTARILDALVGLVYEQQKRIKDLEHSYGPYWIV